MSKSSGVIATRVILAVVLLSLIVSCIYYFIIKARNDAVDADNSIFATYNAMTVSENITKINDSLGNVESGDYYSYAKTNNIAGYKEAYLNLYMSKQLLDSNAYRLITSYGDVSAIQKGITAIEESAKALCNSITVFDTSRKAYGGSSAEKEALTVDFGKIVKDLANYSELYSELAHTIFEYTANSYYKDVKAFSSAQYLYSYCLDKQNTILNSAVKTNVLAVENDIYTESKLVADKFDTVSSDYFNVQTTNKTVKSVISYYLANESFDDLLSAENKSAYVQQITDTERKSKVCEVMTILGLEGRIG